MAYAERVSNRNKTLAVITVAGLHGMALYGLVTGLGVEYVTQVVTVLKGYNEPAIIPPPPPTPKIEPQVVEQASATNARQPVNPPPLDAARNDLGKGDLLVEMPVGPITPFKFEPIAPIVQPTPDKPAFAPKSVRPRNNPGLWATTADYPSSSLRLGEQGTVRFQLAIAADGHVADCRILASSGSSDLDAATCKRVTQRARFEPATDGSGARVDGTYTGSIRWVIPQD
jgi:protein TonB